MFVNNFGKCGPIVKILSPLIRKKILYVYTTKISTSPAVNQILVTSLLLTSSLLLTKNI